MMMYVGMMEGAYFVGRVELLNWLNELLKLDYTKVEQTCTGAAHCQIMDAIYPGVPLSKVNFNAKHEYEYIQNFKVLQAVFDKHKLDKHIDVAKLVKGKYQDNLEFLQWIKRFFDLNFSGGEYNALERRKQTGAAATGSGIGKKAAPAKTSTPAKKVAATPAKTTTAAKTATPAAKTPAKAAVKSPESKSTSSSDSDKKVDEMSSQLAEQKVTIDGLEKERDFYFGKLREVEIMCQQSEDPNADLVQKILKVLYATDENEGFVAEESQGTSEEQPEGETSEEQPSEEIESF